MKSLARLHVWWPTIDQDIELILRRCEICQANQPRSPQGPANPWKWPTSPWHRVHIDFAGPFMGENFLLMVDAHSKWPEVYRMKSTTTERTIEVLRRVFSQHGVPIELVSDNGPQFTSQEFQTFLKLNHVQHILSPPYHPSTNGEAERFVRTFKTAMKAKRTQGGTWSQKISEFLLSYRSTPHSTTRRAPGELLMGRQLRTRLDAVRPNLGRCFLKQTCPDKPTRNVEVGDPVLVRDYRHRQETWIAGVVGKRLSPCSYLIQVGELTWKRHIDQLKYADGSLIKMDQASEEMDQTMIPTAAMTLPSLFGSPASPVSAGADDTLISMDRTKTINQEPLENRGNSGSDNRNYKTRAACSRVGALALSASKICSCILKDFVSK